MNAEIATRTTADDRQATDSEWDQLPAESHRAYEAFALYRDHEGPRCLGDVAAKLSCRLPTLIRWSLRWNWQERCRAFDIAQNERESEDAHRERRAMRRRQISLGRMMQEVANIGLGELEQKVEQKLALGLSPNEIIAMIRVGAELERESRGDDLPYRQHTEIRVIFGNVDDPKAMAGVQAVGQQTRATRNGGNDEF